MRLCGLVGGSVVFITFSLSIVEVERSSDAGAGA